MRWIRSHLRVGAWCGLFALTLQFALSFGHVHVDAGGLKSTRVGAVAYLVLPAAAQHAPAVPANPDSKGPAAADFCDVCALIHLTGTLLSTAAGVEMPADFYPVQLPISADRELVALQPFSFQARAPPIA